MERAMATMQEKMNVQDLILNLEAAGFEKDQIEEYLARFKTGETKAQLALLSAQRAGILAHVHEEEGRSTAWITWSIRSRKAA